ncbi:hypothetical protein, partial [Neisseria bacilliformis]
PFAAAKPCFVCAEAALSDGLNEYRGRLKPYRAIKKAETLRSLRHSRVGLDPPLTMRLKRWAKTHPTCRARRGRLKTKQPRPCAKPFFRRPQTPAEAV